MSSFSGGLVSGLFGVGGGLIDTTAMMLVLGMPTHIAIATSMFGMTITTGAGVIAYGTFGNIAYDYAHPNSHRSYSRGAGRLPYR